MILLGHILTAALALAALTGAVLLAWHGRMSKRRHTRWSQVHAITEPRIMEDVYWNLLREPMRQKALRLCAARHTERILELVK